MNCSSTDANNKWQVSSHRDLGKTTLYLGIGLICLQISASATAEQNFPLGFDYHVLSFPGSDSF